MGISVIFGGQWGSEGKGKTTLFFAKKLNASVVVRVGGTNSGHTIVAEDGQRLAFRILPVASILEGVTCVLPAGSYIDVDVLEKEIQLSGICKKLLKIHPNAVIIKKSDGLHEVSEGLNDKIGSTESGTGSAVISRIKRNSDVLLARDCSTCSQVENRLKNITTPVVFFNTDNLNFLNLEDVEKNVLPIIDAYMKAE